MDAFMTLAMTIAFVVSVTVGVLTYGDALIRKTTHPAAYAISLGAISGIGVLLSGRYSDDIVWGIHREILGQNYITNPFEIPAVGIVLSVAIIVLSVGLYRSAAGPEGRV